MFHFLIQKYRNYGIAKKILIILLCGATIPFLLTDILISSIAANTVTSQTESLIESNLHLSEKGLEDYFTEYDNIIMDIYTDHIYASDLEKLNVWDSNYYGVKRELEDSLQNIVYLHPQILGMAFVTKKRECIMYDSITSSSLNSACFPKQESDWLEIAESTFTNTETLYSNAINRGEQGYDGTVIYLAHRIADINNYGQGTVGSVIICLDEKDIRANYSQDDSATLSFLCNEEGDIISSTQETLLGCRIERTEDINVYEQSVKNLIHEKQLIKTNFYSIFQQTVLNQKFTIISIRNDMELLKDFRYIFGVSALITLLILFFSLLIMVRFANSLQNSVGEITEAMDKAYKGDYTVQITSNRQDEFGKIARHFNHMVQKIDQSGKMEKEALIREKNAELKSLEAQINPHFLYNTLDAINWIAIENEQFQISKMLKDLAVILRYSIHKSNSVVPIQDEMEYLKKYIYLQQQRFSFSFSCLLNIEEEVKGLHMHKLLFQPLVENAIIHGFPGKTGMDTIMISICKKENNQLEICVEDNGKGMPPELVEELNTFDYRKNSVESSIGVRNVIMRIKYYYGEKGTFHIESGDWGTKITAHIFYE